VVLIRLDERDPRPIYGQLVAQIKEQVASGALEPGEELPSVRELADSLGINLHTVHRAYQKLRDDGVISLRLGRRAKVVAPRKKRASREEIESRLTARLAELVTEAVHLGLSKKELRALVDRLIESKMKSGRAR
jgi:DNA-binding transcriptional regulator YhcF (GntR family)